jgi:hypothetical protein
MQIMSMCNLCVKQNKSWDSGRQNKMWDTGKHDINKCEVLRLKTPTRGPLPSLALHARIPIAAGCRRATGDEPHRTDRSD